MQLFEQLSKLFIGMMLCLSKFLCVEKSSQLLACLLREKKKEWGGEQKTVNPSKPGNTKLPTMVSIIAVIGGLGVEICLRLGRPNNCRRIWWGDFLSYDVGAV
jgi:hypothetical protein